MIGVRPKPKSPTIHRLHPLAKNLVVGYPLVPYGDRGTRDFVLRTPNAHGTWGGGGAGYDPWATPGPYGPMATFAGKLSGGDTRLNVGTWDLGAISSVTISVLVNYTSWNVFQADFDGYAFSKSVSCTASGPGTGVDWGIGTKTVTGFPSYAQPVFAIRTASGTKTVQFANSAPTVGTWYLYTGTYDGATMKSFANGAATGFTTSHSGTLSVSTREVMIGAVHATSASDYRSIIGFVAGAWIWSEVLPDNLIREHARDPFAPHRAARARPTVVISTGTGALDAGWTTLTEDSQALDAGWSILLTGTEALPAGWVMQRTASEALPAGWTLELIDQDALPAGWCVLQTDTAALVAGWSAQLTDTDALPAGWTMSLTASEALAAGWATLTTASAALDAGWSALLEETAALPSGWVTRVTDTDALAAGWSTLVTDTVAEPAGWSVELTETAALAAGWTMLQTETAALGSGWSVDLTDEEAIAAGWTAAVTAAEALAAGWSAILVETAALSAGWAILASESAALGAGWTTRVTETEALDSGWTMLRSDTTALGAGWVTSVGGVTALDAGWAALVGATQALGAGWAMLRTAEAAEPAGWTLSSLATAALEAAWSLLATASAALAAGWVTSVTSDLALASGWALMGISIQEMILQNLKSTLEGITSGNGYDVSVVHVSRKPIPVQELPEYPAVLIGNWSETESDQPTTAETQLMSVPLLLWTRDDYDEPEKDLTLFVKDAKKALLVDHTRGGYAIDTDIASTESILGVPNEPYQGALMTLSIHYRHQYGDPETAV